VCHQGTCLFVASLLLQLISATLDRWCWGADNSGDLREAANIRAVWAAARQHAERLGVEGALLVTADGGVDTSMDPIRQEEISTPLHYSELVAALGVLMPGGNLVYKAFTQFHHSSICLLHLMGCLFDEVHVFKPGEQYMKE
jgi:cap2 methyltransferase